MAQPLRPLSSLPKDQDLFSSTYMQLTTLSSVSGDPMPSSGFYRHQTCTQRCKHNTYTHKKLFEDISNPT